MTISCSLAHHRAATSGQDALQLARAVEDVSETTARLSQDPRMTLHQHAAIVYFSYTELRRHHLHGSCALVDLQAILCARAAQASTRSLQAMADLRLLNGECGRLRARASGHGADAFPHSRED